MNHHDARAILRSAWRDIHGREGTSKELLFTQAVAWLENQYGRAGQFGPWAADGKYNWGSLQRVRASFDDPCPIGTMPGQDASNPRCFFVYPTDEMAARAFVTNFTGQKPGYGVAAFPQRNANIVSAMNQGASLDVAQAMVSTGPGQAYFEAAPEAYARVLDGGVLTVAKALGASLPKKTSGATGPLLVLGGLGILGLVAWVTGMGPFEKRRTWQIPQETRDRLRLPARENEGQP